MASRQLITLVDLHKRLIEMGISMSYDTLKRRSDKHHFEHARLSGRRLYSPDDVEQIAARLIAERPKKRGRPALTSRLKKLPLDERMKALNLREPEEAGGFQALDLYSSDKNATNASIDIMASLSASARREMMKRQGVFSEKEITDDFHIYQKSLAKAYRELQVPPNDPDLTPREKALKYGVIPPEDDAEAAAIAIHEESPSLSAVALGDKLDGISSCRMDMLAKTGAYTLIEAVEDVRVFSQKAIQLYYLHHLQGPVSKMDVN